MDMKLAEALIRRADLQKRIAVIKSRIGANIVVQEGSTPAEDPNVLMKEYMSLQKELASYIKNIHKTNNEAMFDETRTIADVIVERDMLEEKRNMLAFVVSKGSEITDRYSTSEIRNVSFVDVKKLQKEADRCSKEYRELDIALQAKNWEVELIEK